MFEPTEKQLCALANMERYAGIGSNRTHFESSTHFTDYWKLISDRCDKQTRQRKRESVNDSEPGKAHGKNPRVENTTQAAKKKQERIKAYYANKDHLLRYAEKYHQRYLPSRNKIEAQLKNKCADKTIVDAVMAIIGPKINDQSTAFDRATRMQLQGKNVAYIKTKLRQRLYEAPCIEKCLNVLTHEHGSIWTNETLEKRIKQLQQQGKSISSIRQKLTEQSNDKPLVEAALSAIFGQSGDLNNLQREYEKLLRKNTPSDKIIKRLMSKGFRYPEINTLLQQSS